MRHIFFLLLILFAPRISYSQNLANPLRVEDAREQKKWVDSVYNALSLEEKVGQLYMVQVMSDQDQQSKNNIINTIRKYHIGGIIYSNGGPVKQAKLNNELQALSKTPLLIGMDAEWGLSMRLDSTFVFPWNMTLGAINNNKLVEKAGKHIGEHCKRLGVHFNFAPVVDINTNPDNPIIGNRSFGEDKINVTEKALSFMVGMQSAGVLACAKHFPGHGDTDQDSHKTLPTVSFDEDRIESVELYPYRSLIKNGLSSVMVAHLNVPALEPREGLPSSLSKHIVTDVLKGQLGFDGLIFTDALTMKGASNFNETGDIDLAAFLAGNDVMLMSEDVGIGISKIVEAYKIGVISEDRLAHSVKKILEAKYKVGLSDYAPINLHNLLEDLNRIEDQVLNEDLIESALTIVKNKNDLLPIRNLETKKIAYVNLGDDSGSYFINELKKYTKVNEVDNKQLNNRLLGYNTVIVGLHRSNESPWKSYKFTKEEISWLEDIAKDHMVILDVFVKPYALSDLKELDNIESIVVSYQNSKLAQEKSAQLIFGAIAANGKLPVSAGSEFPVGAGITSFDLKRLGYTIPEREGMSSERLNKIDSIAQRAVDLKMTPGIQLLVARHGKVVYNKNFGKHTYEGKNYVKDEDIYDVASLTKILATLPLLMELEENGIVSLDARLGDILPEYKNSNKANITIKEMLSHYARLRPWEPFYYHTLNPDTKRPSAKYYRTQRNTLFNIEVTKNMYLRSDYPDSIQKIIKESELLPKLRYRYSDFPYYILKKYIEGYYNKGLDELVQEHFYQSIGANHTTYNPFHTVSDTKIVPTEMDDYYRYQEIHGYVHDMGAAMQNGVGGHAGIFSNANDVAKIMQMYLQKGFYGGKRFLKPETIDKFNTCYFCEQDNRRGVGFDKPQIEGDGPTCGCVSLTSFGHSGFTGTYAWADPDADILYVFMANRTFPKAGKNTLLRENVRTDIQELIYEAIIE
ncbi:glycoside hydrolase family 3 N-terminal domain-containing protein [Gaetbulibacter sp. M240]|uniref:glycoside hydrolase family 3 N-terminal domain-containing protein n=1 Tax=Gaetbulibacter sp. M240 TaxID=3126511 RepID=UPI00374E2A3F